MMLLPKDVGPFTLVRKLGTGTVAESYLGTLHGSQGGPEGGRPVVVRRILPFVLRDPARLASTEARVRDLVGVRHPFLVRVLDWVEHDGERFIVEERVDGVDLDRVLAWCRQSETPIPGNVFLHLATQICNGLEALHGRPGRGTGADSVLHLGLRPAAILVGREGKVVLGGFGLARSPMAMSHGGPGSPVSVRMEYLSPEQTQGDQRLSPASDIFSLGAVLYELLTRDPLFRSDSNLQTIHRIRKAEVTSELLRVKELMPGLDKVLYRALSLDPRHRYQRAFVLREDLRGLMAGYSFSSILEDARSFFAPLIQDVPVAGASTTAAPSVPAPSVPAPSVPAPSVPAPSVPPPTPAAVEEEDVGAGVQDAAESVPVEESLFSDEELLFDSSQDPAAEDPAAEVSAAEVSAAEVSAAEEPPAPPAAAEPPPIDAFDDEEATRIDPPPVAPAVPGAPDDGGHPDTTAAFIDEVPAAADLPPEEAEDLAERRTLPVPPMSADLPDEEPPTDLTPAAPPSPGAAADLPERAPVVPPLSVAPPAVPGVAAPRAGAAQQPESLQPESQQPGTQQPESQQPESQQPGATPAQSPAAPALQPPASPGPHESPLPPAAPAPAAADDFDDLDYKPRGNNTLLLVALGVAGLVVVCGGGLFAGVRYVQDQADQTFQQVAEALEDAAPVEGEGSATDGAATDGAATDGAATDGAAADGAAVDDAAVDDAAQPAGTGQDRLAALDEAPADSARTTAPTRTEPRPTVERRDERASTASGGGSGSDRAALSRPGTSSGSSSAASGSSSQPERRVRPAPTTLRPPAATADPVSEPALDPALDPATGEPVADVGAEEGIDPAELDRYSTSAASGRLSPSDVMALETVAVTDPAYTRSRALLLMHAQAKGDERAAGYYLDELMVLPENQYNPVYLSEQARIFVNEERYAQALEKARLAERYWARLPPDLVFSKKAEIYETQAAALQGRFYASRDDLELLDDAVRHWKKYRDHVQTRSRAELAARADTEIAKLEDIRGRLQ